MFQEPRNQEEVALHGLCCGAPKSQKLESGEKQEQRQRVDEAERPAYSLPCD